MTNSPNYMFQERSNRLFTYGNHRISNDLYLRPVVFAMVEAFVFGVVNETPGCVFWLVRVPVERLDHSCRNVVINVLNMSLVLEIFRSVFHSNRQADRQTHTQRLNLNYYLSAYVDSI